MAVAEAELTADFSKGVAGDGKSCANDARANESAVDMLHGLLKDASLGDIASIRDERLKKHESNA